MSAAVEQYYVYILTASDDSVLYVGHTSDPGRRMREHSTKSWAHQVDHCEVFEAHDKENALYIERNFIAHTRPRYNVQSKPCPIKKMIREERELYDLLTSD